MIKVSENGGGFETAINADFTISGDTLTLIYTDEDEESRQIYEKK